MSQYVMDRRLSWRIAIYIAAFAFHIYYKCDIMGEGGVDFI